MGVFVRLRAAALFLALLFTIVLPTFGSEAPRKFGKLPMSFEANRGQTDAEVKFLARGHGYMLFLTPEAAVLKLREGRANGLVLRIKPVGGSPTVQIGGEGELPGKSNYFLDTDPKHWYTNIPTYRGVRYAQVYPGVDLVFYGRQGQVEFDYRLAPQAETRQIVMEYEGANELKIEQGALLIRVGEKWLRQDKPSAYQQTGIGGQRSEVKAEYVLLGRNRVGFRVGAYDRARELVIDPILKYSTYLGGAFSPQPGQFSANTFGRAVAVDSTGHAYVAGETTTTDFPTTSGAYDRTSAGGGTSDNGGSEMGVAYVTKFNTTGTGLIYSTYIGGNGMSGVYGVAVDGSGNAYITGQTGTSKYPTTAGAFQTTFKGPTCDTSSYFCQGDAFVTKLNASGSGLVYSTFLGGTDYDTAAAIAVDGSGNAYVTGGTQSTDFPVKNAFQPKINTDTNCSNGRASNCGNAFLTKLNSTGTGLIFSTYYGSGFGTDGRGITVDSSGNAYVTGSTAFTSGLRSTRNFGGTSDGYGGYVLKVSSSGGFLWSDTIESGIGQAIAVDQYHQAYITGLLNSPRLPVTAGAFQTAPKGAFLPAFVTKISSDGTSLKYSTYLGGSGGDTGYGIGVDSQDHAYVTGQTSSDDFPVTSSAFQSSRKGGQNAFVTMLATAGNGLMYSTYLGGSNADYGYAIAVDKSWNAYVVGNALSSDFPVTPGAFQSSLKGSMDAFLAKVIIVADLAITKTASATAIAHGGFETYTITVTNNGPDPAWGTTVTDVLPSGEVFESVSTSMGSCTHPSVGYGGTVTCKTSFFGSPGKTWTIKLTVKMTASSGAKITNKATVKSSTQDTNVANNSSSVTVSVF